MWTPGMWSRTLRTAPPGAIPAGPMTRPSRTATTTATAPPTAHATGCRFNRSDPRALGGAHHDLQELRNAWPPARGDVVVEGHHVTLLDGGQVRPPGPGRNRRRRLVAALGVGQEDEVGLGLQHELVRQLRVAAGLVLGGVGDVLQPHHLVELSDERVRRN